MPSIGKKIAALHRKWWRLHMRETFSIIFNNTCALNIFIRGFRKSFVFFGEVGVYRFSVVMCLLEPYVATCMSQSNFCKVFILPEPKTQLILSDDNLSVVYRRRCRCSRLRKLFTFSSSSPEPLDQFQPNLTQSILRWRGFKLVQIKGQSFFQKKSSSAEPVDQFRLKQ